MTGIGKRGESVVIAGTVRVWSEGRGCRSGQRAEVKKCGICKIVDT